MPQSNVIFGFLFAAFVIYITQRGELPVYLGFILATPKAAPAPLPTTPSEKVASSSVSTSDVAKLAASFLV